MANLTMRVRRHYDLLTPLYYGLWGRHVHHGYWNDADDAATPAAAQERLLHEIIAFADCPPPASLLDVGCGFAGSLIWLARATRTQGIGITVSPLQCLVGRLTIRAAGLHNQLQVQVADAQQHWALPDASVDLVWCVECSEHLVDRAHVAREARRVLRPGGVLVVAAWLAGVAATRSAEELRAAVAAGMLCYPFDTADAYAANFRAAGLTGIRTRLITPHVLRTWDHCLDILAYPGLTPLSRVLGGDIDAFTRSFAQLRQAYREGAMEYGLLRAELA